MKLASANCTSWNSIIDVLETDMLDNPHLIAIQEHKFSCCDKINQAKKKAKECGFMAFLPKCQRAKKEANSSGVGFLWSNHVVAQNPGEVFCDTRNLSIEVGFKNNGLVLPVSFFGVSSMPKNNIK